MSSKIVPVVTVNDVKSLAENEIGKTPKGAYVVYDHVAKKVVSTELPTEEVVPPIIVEDEPINEEEIAAPVFESSRDRLLRENAANVTVATEIADEVQSAEEAAEEAEEAQHEAEAWEAAPKIIDDALQRVSDIEGILLSLKDLF